MKWYLKVLRQYTDFKGRARRKEYWMFTLFHIIFIIIATFIDGALGTSNPTTGYGVITWIYLVALLVPSLAVGARRLHDIGRSGWMLLIGLIPVIGSIWLLILFVKDSEGENKYGPNPK